MALPASGAISMNDIRTELGSSGTISLNDSPVRALAGKGGAGSSVILPTDFYGKSNAPVPAPAPSIPGGISASNASWGGAGYGGTANYRGGYSACSSHNGNGGGGGASPLGGNGADWTAFVNTEGTFGSGGSGGGITSAGVAGVGTQSGYSSTVNATGYGNGGGSVETDGINNSLTNTRGGKGTGGLVRISILRGGYAFTSTDVTNFSATRIVSGSNNTEIEWDNASGTKTSDAVYNGALVGSFTVPTGVTAIGIHLIAGGGGGAIGPCVNAGGGGGGAVYYQNYAVTPGTTYVIKVGAGGQGGLQNTARSSAGGPPYGVTEAPWRGGKTSFCNSGGTEILYATGGNTRPDDCASVTNADSSASNTADSAGTNASVPSLPGILCSVTPNTFSVDEGSSDTFNVTSNVINGTTLYWTINNVTTSSADFTATSGSFVMSSGSSSFSVFAVADSTTEGTETFTVSVRTGSTSGTVIGTSSSISINDISTGAAPTVPGVPTIGTATSTGQTTATVAFTAPASNGGAAITGYTVAVYNYPSGTSTGITATGSTSPISVTGLTAGTSYTFKVKATNSVGDSAYSSASNQITTTAASTVPGAPTIGTAIATGQNSATVAFTPPASNGGAAITSYTVTSSPGGITATGATSPITITGLSSGTAYTFTVYATNSVGNSTPSSASNSTVTSTPAVPQKPTGVSATPTGTTTATVSFTAPSNSGGSPITQYIATSSPGGITGTLNQAGSGTITVSGLTAATSYTFTVKAVNSAGQSDPSDPSISITTNSIATVPGAPTITGAVATGTTTADVSFSAPSSNGGSPITSYTILSSPGSITATLSQAGSGTFNVTGLTSGTTYTFTIKATNAVGDSSYSSASSSITTTSSSTVGFIGGTAPYAYINSTGSDIPLASTSLNLTFTNQGVVTILDTTGAPGFLSNLPTQWITPTGGGIGGSYDIRIRSMTGTCTGGNRSNYSIFGVGSIKTDPNSYTTPTPWVSLSSSQTLSVAIGSSPVTGCGTDITFDVEIAPSGDHTNSVRGTFNLFIGGGTA